MIVADHVSKLYGPRWALSDLSFAIDQGEVVGFLGLNGAGKTTVLKILSGLLWPSSGRVRIEGHDSLEDPRAVRRLTGFLPDRPPLYGEMTVRAMLRYAARINGVSAKRVDGRVEEVIELCRLREVADDLVEWLSHGYRQRVGIAQAIAHEPALVILDEPISGLDPEQIVGMRGLIRDLTAHHTVLLSSHILSETEHTCDRILVLHQGRIVAQGMEHELRPALFSGRVAIRLRGTREDALRVAGGISGVSEPRAEPAGERAAEEGLIELQVTVQDEHIREALVAALVGAGLGVRRVAEADGGLESVFLRLTRGAAEAGP